MAKEAGQRVMCVGEKGDLFGFGQNPQCFGTEQKVKVEREREREGECRERKAGENIASNKEVVLQLEISTSLLYI